MDWVETRDVWKRYGATIALRGVSARFEKGTITIVEGPNGAGKTTLLGLLATVSKPTMGSIWYEPTGDGRADGVRGRIGWVGHESLCYSGLTARENVALAMRLRGMEGSRAWEDARERFSLGVIEDRACGTLSRGQLQRVALARGLVGEPPLVLLDEPYAGLDTAGVEKLDRVVVEERERGAIVVMVSHDPGAVGRLRGRRVRLERGRIVAQ